MEPTTLATATIATLFASEAVKAGGKAFGEGTSKLVSQLLTVIRNRFKAADTEGLLTSSLGAGRAFSQAESVIVI